MDRLRAGILIAHARVERERLRLEIARLRGKEMARDLQSLEMGVGQFVSDMDDEAAKVFDQMDAVRAKAGDVFTRTKGRIAAKAATVDNVDKLITSLDRSNSSPTSGGSSNGSGTSSEQKTQPPADSAEKKT